MSQKYFKLVQLLFSEYDTKKSPFPNVGLISLKKGWFFSQDAYLNAWVWSRAKNFFSMIVTLLDTLVESWDTFTYIQLSTEKSVHGCKLNGGQLSRQQVSVLKLGVKKKKTFQ